MTGKYPAPAESAAKATAVALKVESTARSELEKRVESLERDLARVGEESGMQSEWAASTQGYLDAVEPSRDDGGGGRLPRNDDDQYGPEAVATSDIIALKLKAAHLVEKLRQEKYAWLKSEREAQKMGAKVGYALVFPLPCSTSAAQGFAYEPRKSPSCIMLIDNIPRDGLLFRKKV